MGMIVFSLFLLFIYFTSRSQLHCAPSPFFSPPSPIHTYSFSPQKYGWPPLYINQLCLLRLQSDKANFLLRLEVPV